MTDEGVGGDIGMGNGDKISDEYLKNIAIGEHAFSKEHYDSAIRYFEKAPSVTGIVKVLNILEMTKKPIKSKIYKKALSTYESLAGETWQ